MKPFEQPIYVTRPFLPPLYEYVDGLREIWTSQWLTNNGPVLIRFKNKLAGFFQTDNICLFGNGSLALQIGLKGLGLSGTVITTPFTFVATTHAIVWNGLSPVFGDIEADYFTLDPGKVDALITPETCAILAVHVFGFPCRLKQLAEIAEKHNLALIYDAAHAFGVKVNGDSIALQGDLSTLSFHATKHFHTIEGGAITFQKPERKQIFEQMTNNGFEHDSEEVSILGTNAKMNEFQALMGEKILGHVDHLIARKKLIANVYQERLGTLDGIRFCPPLASSIDYNYCFMPVQIIESECGRSRDYLCEELKKYNIFTKKYFFPLIPDLKYYRNTELSDPLTVARQVGKRVLILPNYPMLELADVHKICDIIINIHSKISIDV